MIIYTFGHRSIAAFGCANVNLVRRQEVSYVMTWGMFDFFLPYNNRTENELVSGRQFKQWFAL